MGTAHAPNKSDISNIHYLSAVIRETQRLSGVAPFLSRLATDNFEVQGYLLPKDSQMMLNFNSALQDEETWKDADKFYPERFLDENGHFIKRNEHIPFGLGRRICPGMGKLWLEWRLIFSCPPCFNGFCLSHEIPLQNSSSSRCQAWYRPRRSGTSMPLCPQSVGICQA
ncbi:cytochrome P450 2D15 [Elysia marginata]|uniref:Cytochrome P450 2D15 n=1 Tax=Elysia marginata TaxID=1093978 RepID=A0AAV4IX85_9GAST|nr:cytochrome P450 2D15 [Elysia marginata]